MTINQIPTGALKDSAVTSEKIGNSEVATVDIENSAVTSEKIAAGAVQTAKIADGAVTADKVDETVATKGSSIALSIALG